MKVLMIGMDGAHLDAFDRGWTPYIASLIKNGTRLMIKNDLISRGWLEIVTGRHGVDTGALYDKPKANRSHEWDLQFNINNIPGLGETVKPVWQVLSEKGVRVGVMNLPTAYPAPQVNGFFVSGGGGGAPVVQTPSLEHCYPREEFEFLVKQGYIVDERIVPLLVEKKITDPSEIFFILENKNKKRTSSFIELAKKYQIDFGFVVYKSSANLAEWLLLPEWKRMQEGAKDVDTQLIGIIKDYYVKFDMEVRKLHETFPEAEIILVSDHGLVAREWSVNPNILLQEKGFQKAHRAKDTIKYSVETLKRMIPFSWRSALRKRKAINSVLYSTPMFDIENTLAFCKTQGDWLQGIFINDRQRFGGPLDESEIDKVKEKIIKAFAEDIEVRRYGFHAYSKKEYPSPTSLFFPDIVIDVPDGFLITDKIKYFVERFIPPNGALNLLSITKGNLLCIKAHYPITVIYNGKCRIPEISECLDLTAVYDHIITVFE